MPELEPLLRDITGFVRDTARDRLPRGVVWDLVDYIPAFADAPLRGRDGWAFQSNALPAAPGAMIYAPFKASDRLLAFTDNGHFSDVERDMGVIGSTEIAAPTVWYQRANPVFFNDLVYTFDAAGAQPPIWIAWNGSGYGGGGVPATASNPGRCGAIYSQRLVVGGSAANPNTVAFSKPGNPQAAWEPTSTVNMPQPVVGLATMRNALLVFHKGSVSRIRGDTPPDPALSADLASGNLQADSLFDKAGLFDARSIAYWNDNVLWADSHGCHITDGGLVRNLVSQGGILSLWRQAFQNAVSCAGTTFLDYYVICLRTSDKPPLTLVCDIPKRLWFRITNVDVTCMASSVGMFERLWGGDVATPVVVGERGPRVNVLSKMFFPATDTLTVDDDGKPVLGVIETGWFRLGKEGKKRIRNLYVSYDHRLGTQARGNSMSVSWVDSPDSYSWHLSRRSLRGTFDYTRQRVPIERGAYGMAFRLEQLVPSLDVRVYDLGLDAWSQEEGYL